ncbi:cation transporter, partial [Candidatus Fermentibacterales bacterium]|nr:cation transporter [Candidatus Fermentibacterales bacterium]
GDLNLRSAFLHMVADAAVSLSVVAGGLVMLLSGWSWVDPVLSMVISLAVLRATWGLLLESGNLALDAVPGRVDPDAVRDYLLSVEGVEAMHDFHIWGLSTTETALTAHLIVPGAGPCDELLHELSRELHERFGISHTTLQVETGGSTHRCVLDGEGCERSGSRRSEAQ